MLSNIPDRDYSSLEIANHFINCSPCTNMKLQKLVYIAYGFCLAFYDKPLVANENPQVWEYGPVFPELYQEAKGHTLIKKLLGKGQKPCGDVDEFLDAVWYKYGRERALTLSNLTHKEGTPWHITKKKNTKSSGELPRDLVIPDDVIKSHYRSINF